MTDQAEITRDYKIYVQGQLHTYEAGDLVSGWVAQKAIEDDAAKKVRKRKTAAPENKAMAAPESKARKPRKVKTAEDE